MHAAGIRMICVKDSALLFITGVIWNWQPVQVLLPYYIYTYLSAFWRTVDHVVLARPNGKGHHALNLTNYLLHNYMIYSLNKLYYILIIKPNSTIYKILLSTKSYTLYRSQQPKNTLINTHTEA
jgi:hypothetical protein